MFQTVRVWWTRQRHWMVPLLLGGVYLLICALIGWRLVEHARAHPTGQVLNDTTAGPLYGPTTMGQVFQSEFAGLYRIDVTMATYARVNTQDVVFTLRASPTTTVDLATVVVNARDIADNSWQRFEFAPISDSDQRTYYFFLTSPTSTPDDAVTVYGRTTDNYAAGQAYLNDQPAVGDLTFLVYYQETPLAQGNTIMNRLTRDKPGWLGERWFYVVLGAINLILTTALLMAVGYWTQTRAMASTILEEQDGASHST
ncbi:MAG: hypothetical protein KKA73_20205 [Chloroflexi bacterium]|nr:hypothetical protein [Chloroflexota bacterium]MBU1750013.1 hypothetical protein [Chloroflexota bacterium]